MCSCQGDTLVPEWISHRFSNIFGLQDCLMISTSTASAIHLPGGFSPGWGEPVCHPEAPGTLQRGCNADLQSPPDRGVAWGRCTN